MLRQTKIVASIGPASSSPDTLRALLLAGVNVMRINFSHADASALPLMNTIRQIATELHLPLAIMADLQGPKIRIGCFRDQRILLQEGQGFTLNCQDAKMLGGSEEVYVNYPELIHEVHPGDQLLLNDGLISLQVVRIVNFKIHCVVLEGGELSDRKGLNKKGGGLSARTLTEKDKQDLQTAIAAQVDYISLSFVKDAQDIRQTRLLLAQNNSQQTAIIAKIERAEAIEHLQDIAQEADALMVARGDLGVEVGVENVPALQKQMIRMAKRFNKVVITATQMMESMIYNPQPTCAEVSDVANAILDGTDAVMLSAETASGHYPVKVVQMVHDICLSVEKNAQFNYRPEAEHCAMQRPDEAIAVACMHAANHFPVQAIVCLTESGDTAIWISRQHSLIPIIAVSGKQRTISRLSLVHNVQPVFFNYYELDVQTINQQVLKQLLQEKYIQPKGFVLFTRGRTIGQAGGTNCLELLEVPFFIEKQGNS